MEFVRFFIEVGGVNIVMLYAWKGGPIHPHFLKRVGFLDPSMECVYNRSGILN
jgi:hypothetical protein